MSLEVESLESPKIKIFVSNRIDIDSELIDNPIYIPVRCGAVYDKRLDSNILGDDTGDNISEKRMSFCEFTVQYWAWKNQDADYYGLCHYRRYLSFSNTRYDSDYRNQVIEKYLTKDSMSKYGFLSEEKLRKEINKYDVIVSEYADVKKIPTVDGNKKSVIEHWKSSKLIEPHIFDELLLIIKESYPKYYTAAKEYVLGSKHRGYNCFILKKELFNELCEFQFGILFELEKIIDTKFYSETLNRAVGFMGEILFGIFIYYIEKEKKYNIETKQLVFFENTENVKDLTNIFNKKNVPIVIRICNYDVPYLGIFLKSFIKYSSKENHYDIIILNKDVTKTNQIKIESILKNNINMSIRFYNPGRILNDIDFYDKKEENCSEESYYSIFLPWILPHYEKVIVIDIDIVVKVDLAELLNIDLDGNIAAGVKDIVFQGLLNSSVDKLFDYAKEELKMEQPYNYIDTGVLVVNLEKLRDKYTTEEILSLCKNNNFRMKEQDILNVILEKNVKFLNPSWNFYVESHEGVEHVIKMAPQISEIEYRNVHKNDNHPLIIHYSNIPKPWSNPEIKLAREFWDLARETIFYEELISRLVNEKTHDIRHATYDLQCRLGIFDNRSSARKFADKFLPSGSHRREFVKFLIPRDSIRWKLCKKIYFIFKPQYRKVEN